METLEKRIRELVPSLQELSFGCEFIYYEEEEYTGGNTFEVKDVVVKVVGKRTVDDSIYIKGVKTEYEFDSERDFKILGHPIQLHHVLQAVGKGRKDTAYKNVVTVGDDGLIWEELGKEGSVKCVGNWDLTKPLSGQSEEVVTFLNEILN